MMSDERIVSALHWIISLLAGIWLLQFSQGCQLQTIQYQLGAIHQCEK
jgi:hypothetical protein